MKDPSVIQFHRHFFLYYSIPSSSSHDSGPWPPGWGIGIAQSDDLHHWSKVGEVTPAQEVEKNGIAAPGARVIQGKVHLFYQTYGNGAKDAICHAWSDDGIHFEHDPSNPIYHPTQMEWSVGRAIDAEVLLHGHTAYLYFATRDPSMKNQMIGMAEADISSGLGQGAWHDVSIAEPLLKPELAWEGECVEAPSVVRHGNHYFMFYAGSYNTAQQQIGVAISRDAKHWKRISNEPFLRAGLLGTWNASESGHPGVIEVGDKTYLFFQGNNDKGFTYAVSMVEIGWRDELPYIVVNDVGK